MSLIAIKCACGAITIEDEDNTFDNSMTQETFDELFGDQNIPFREQGYHGCNHCVNKWGIDICGCGSGEPVGECDGDLAECRAKEASQVPFQRKKSGVEAMAERGGFV